MWVTEGVSVSVKVADLAQTEEILVPVLAQTDPGEVQGGRRLKEPSWMQLNELQRSFGTEQPDFCQRASLVPTERK